MPVNAEKLCTDSSLTMQTPEGVEFILFPAGIAARAAAWVIDTFFQWLLLSSIIFSAGFLDLAVGVWIIFLLLFVLNWFYHVAFEIFWRGQSPGKRFIGIRVVRGDGSPVNPGASFLRNLLRFADTFMFLYHIAFVCILVSPGFRRLGDWAGDTLVVYAESARFSKRFFHSLGRQNDWLADFPAIIPPRRLDYEEKQAILAFSRQYPVLGKARSDEIAKIWTDSLNPPDDAASAIKSPAAYLLGLARTIGG